MKASVAHKELNAGKWWLKERGQGETVAAVSRCRRSSNVATSERERGCENGARRAWGVSPGIQSAPDGDACGTRLSSLQNDNTTGRADGNNHDAHPA